MQDKALSTVAWAAARLKQHASWAPSLLQAVEAESLHRLQEAQRQAHTASGTSDETSAGAAAAASADGSSPAGASMQTQLLAVEFVVDVLHALALAGRQPTSEFVSAVAGALQMCTLSLQVSFASMISTLAKLELAYRACALHRLRQHADSEMRFVIEQARKD